MNKIELLGGALAGMMFLSGCAPATETNKNQTTESAPTPGRPATINSTTETLVSLTDQVTATEVVTDEEKNKEQIVQNINAFLNGEGQYSDESLKDKIFIYGPDSSLITSGLVKNDLGLLSINSEFAVIQGINLGAVRSSDNVWVFWGTKMGDDNKREVVPVKLSLEDIDHRMPPEILFYNQLNIYDDSAVAPEYIESKTIKMMNGDDILTAVNSLIGRPFIVDLYYKYSGNLQADVRSVVNQKGGTDSDFNIVYKLYSEMFKVHSNSVCDFHPVAKELIKKDQNCGNGYSGTEISSNVKGFDSDWLNNSNSISTTILTTYVDNDK